MNTPTDFDAALRQAIHTDMDAHPAPSGLADRLLAQARRASTAPEPEPEPEHRRERRVLVPLLAAAATIVIAGGGALLISVTKDNPHPATPAASGLNTSEATIAGTARPATTPSESAAALPAANSVTPSTAKPALAECTKADLQLSYGMLQPAMHNYGVELHFTNISSTACTAQGYPGVAVLDGQGKQVTQARRTLSGFLGGLSAGTTPPALVLQPNAKATALLEIPTTDAAGDICPTSTRILVTAPDDTVSTQLDVTVPNCTPGQAAVHPLLEGSSGATTTPDETGTPPCLTANLQFSTSSGGGAGGTAYSLGYFTNVGSTTCALYGFPAYAGLDAAGQIVQHAATPSNRVMDGGEMQTAQASFLLLTPGKRAQFVITNDDAVPNPDCPTEFPITSIRVTPPGQSTSITQPAPGGAICDLTVGPVTAAG